LAVSPHTHAYAQLCTHAHMHAHAQTHTACHPVTGYPEITLQDESIEAMQNAMKHKIKSRPHHPQPRIGEDRRRRKESSYTISTSVYIHT